MTIRFTNEENEYLYTDKHFKLRLKDNTPDEIKEELKKKIEVFNEWIDEMNGVKK